MVHILAYLILSVLLIVSPVSLADELKLSGIMNGPNPTAIINDQVVAAGDSVSGHLIVEIRADHVICQGPRGQWVLHLNEGTDPSPPPKKPVLVNWPFPSKKTDAADQPAGRTEESLNISARKSLERSLEYLKQGDAFLRSPLMFERLYSKAAQLCDDADREAQNAFRQATDDAFRSGVKKHLDRVRLAKQMVLKEKANFNTHVRTLIAARQVKTGMTSRDVIASWGPPLMQNRDGQVEKWVFQDQNGYQKELVFKDGILIGY